MFEPVWRGRLAQRPPENEPIKGQQIDLVQPCQRYAPTDCVRVWLRWMHWLSIDSCTCHIWWTYENCVIIKLSMVRNNNILSCSYIIFWIIRHVKQLIIWHYYLVVVIVVAYSKFEDFDKNAHWAYVIAILGKSLRSVVYDPGHACHPDSAEVNMFGGRRQGVSH